MGQILVRNLDDAVIDRLKANAAGAGVSLEQSARDILTEAARPSRAEIIDEIDRIRATSKPSPKTDSTDIIRDWRDHGRDRH
jgi:plasmid stability protein